jgi:copper chaperone
MKTQLIIEGMSCGHCVRSVQEALENVEGVTSADVSLGRNCAEVEHDADVAALVRAVEEEGYKAKVG